MKLTTQPTKSRQIVSKIKENIINGNLKSGMRLSTVRELTKTFGTSPSVVQSAIQTLIQESYIENCGHSGYYVSSRMNQEQTEEVPVPAKKYNTIPLIVIHHNDLVWRRNYDEYDEIRRRQIKHLLALCKKDDSFTFGIEQADIIKRYLEQEPGDRAILTKLIKSGRLELNGAICIQDLNMVCGESILLCHLMAQEYYQKEFGFTVQVDSLTDAFGMCGQIPQILALSGFRYLIPGRMVNRNPKELTFPFDGLFSWVGLDGSSVFVTAREGRFVGHGAPISNSPILCSNSVRVRNMLRHAQQDDVNSLLIYTTEEDLVTPDLSQIIADVNGESERKIAFRNAQYFFENADRNDIPKVFGEFNPCFSGCFTTRITNKQRLRKAERQLFEEEMLDAFKNTPPRNFRDAWYQLFLIGFHDAICGCVTDHAEEQIIQKGDFVLTKTAPDAPKKDAKTFTVFSFNGKNNTQLASSPVPPDGVPCQKDGDQYLFEYSGSYTAKSFAAAKKAPAADKKCAASFKTDYYTADFSTGCAKITNRNGINTFGKDFGEIRLRADYGTMWQEEYPGAEVWTGRAVTEEKLVECTEGPVFIKAVTEGKIKDIPAKCGNIGILWPGFESLKFRKEYIFPKHADYFSLKLTLDWKGCNTKVAIRFPTSVEIRNARSVYSVPFGIMNRKPYFEVPYEEKDTARLLYGTGGDVESVKGDWTALNWVDYSDSEKGLAVANNGTPGHELKSGDIMVSLLRSGTMPKDGGLVPQQGSFDNGTHVYRFAFCAHGGDDIIAAETLGQMLNRPARAVAGELPEGQAIAFSRENIVISAVRKTDNGILVRAYETMGLDSTVSLSGYLTDRKTVYAADAYGLILHDVDPAMLVFKPFEIRTFILGKKK